MSSVSSVPRQNCRWECMCRGRCIEGRNYVVADEKFPQGPSFPALGHKQGPEGAWETLWHCTCNSILCVLALYLHWVFELCRVCTQRYSGLVQLHCYLRFRLWPVNYTISDPWSSHIVHYGFLQRIIEHCPCTIFPTAKDQKELPDRGSGRPNLNAVCIVPFFRTAVCRKNCGFLWGKSSSSTVCPVRVSFVLL